MYNTVIEGALRHLLAEYPSMYWDELALYVKCGLQNLVCSSHGYHPFELTFKQVPVNLHTQWMEAACMKLLADVEKLIANLVENLLQHQQTCSPEV